MIEQNRKGDHTMSKGILEIMREIPDPRKGNAILHKLDEILTIAILAIICDYTQFTEMELFGIEQEEWLRSFLTLEHGIPSHDTFGDVFAAIDPEAFRKGFMEWTESIRKEIKDEVVAIDGKTIRGSKSITENKKPVHIVSAWAAENGLVLGEVATDEKSNEITAIPKLLKMLHLKGCIVTIDAMGTQKDIAQEIAAKEADYILPVKENHPSLLEDIRYFFREEATSCEYAKTTEKSHGRLERRECYISTNIDWIQQKNEWKGLSGIGMIVSHVQTIGQETEETAVHYVLYSKKDMTAAQVLAAKRRHWSVENSLHWVLDVDFGEDSSRMRVQNAAENVNIARHLALNLLKSEKSFNRSLNLKRKKCLLSHDYLLKVFLGA